MSDREIEKVSHDGITIGGVPLNEYLAEEEAEQEDRPRSLTFNRSDPCARYSG